MPKANLIVAQLTILEALQRLSHKTPFMVQELGHTGSLAYEAWPAYDEKLLTSSTFNLPIQVRPAFAFPGQLNSSAESQLASFCNGLSSRPHADVRRLATMQVNGKLRGTVEVAKDISQRDAESIAHEQEGVAKFLNGKQIKKTIFVPGRILNFIVSK